MWQRSPWRVSLSTNPWNDVSTSHSLSYKACFTPIYSLMNRFLRLIWPFTSCLCFKDLTVQLVAASDQRSPEPRETAASEVDWSHSQHHTWTPDELRDENGALRPAGLGYGLPSSPFSRPNWPQPSPGRLEDRSPSLRGYAMQRYQTSDEQLTLCPFFLRK